MDIVIAACCVATVAYVPAFMATFNRILARFDQQVEAEPAAERSLSGLAAEPVLLKQAMFSGSARPFARAGEVVRFPGHGEIVAFPRPVPADMDDLLARLSPTAPQVA